MHFQTATAPITPGTTGPDPVANPGDVPDELLLRLPERRPILTTPLLTVYATLDADPGETVTGDVWVQDDNTGSPGDSDDPNAGKPDRRFYLLLSAVTLTARQLTPLAVAGNPPGGTYYWRASADTLTAPGIVRFGGI